jgi:hypothetical protein
MAVTESDYLHIRTENASFLLLRNSTHFHLIRIDAGLSEAKMAKLLRIYPCEANRLRELGISFSAFKSTSLRGVTIKGYRNGDPIEFWLGSIVREYQLDTDYSEEFIHNFFAGHFINNRLPPKWDGLERNLIRKITWSLNWFSCACSAAFLWLARPYWLWSVLCILCQIAALVVVLIYPSSFTLLENRKQKYLNAGKGHLLPAYSAPLFVLGLRTLRDFTFEGRAFLSLFLTSVAVSCGVTLLLYVFVFRKNPRIRHPIGEAVAMVILTVFLSFGMVGQLNYLLDFHYTTEHIAEVVSKDYEYSTKSTTYSCTAQLPNGQTIELSIDGRTYQAIQVGDDVLVTHHEGTFRIPFFTIQTFSQ